MDSEVRWVGFLFTQGNRKTFLPERFFNKASVDIEKSQIN